MFRGALSLFALAALPLASSTFARADDCATPVRPWVAVRLHGPGWNRLLADAVFADLGVELARDGLLVCPADVARRPVAIVSLTIEATAPDRMLLALDITDEATGKPATRALELGSIPADGHPLAVAVAADELLASSWIKRTARAAAAAPAGPPPSAAPEVTPAPVATKRNALELLLAAERFAGGGWNPGADLAFRRWLWPRWALGACVGARRAQHTNAADGRVHSRAVPFAVGAQASIAPASARARAGLAAALVLTTVTFDAQPAAGAIGVSRTLVAMHARGELWADVALASLRLRAAAGAGAPLRGAVAEDDGVPVVGARGLALHAQLGLGWEF